MALTRSKSLLIIYTGGTIGMVEDPKTHALRPFEFENIVEEIHELKRMGLDLSSVTLSPPFDSSNVSPKIWIRLADLIEENYPRYDGFVVLHGTDTMAYTASALSFMFECLKKPIIFTGSQLPIGSVRTDAKENLVASIEIAAAMNGEGAVVPEVAIFFQDRLFRGNRTTKHNAEEFKAFRSFNYPALAEIGVHIKYNFENILNPEKFGRFRVFRKLDPRVAILKIYPGITRDVVQGIFSIPDLRAIVIELYGSGNAPNDFGILAVIKHAVEKGVIVVGVTQCAQGAVDMSMYQTGNALIERGVTGGYDITTEAAICKLMVLLGKYKTNAEIKLNLNKSLRGEITLS